MEMEINAEIFKIDACFETLPTSAYTIIIGLNRNSIQMLVFDPEKNKFIAFQQNNFQLKGGYAVYAEHIKNVISENALIKNNYKDTVIVWETQRTTFVPNALFDAGEQEIYFRFNQGNEPDEKIMNDKLINTEVYNIYSIPDVVAEFSPVSGSKIVHHASVFVESMMIFSKHKISGKQVFVNVHSTFFDLLVVENNKLLFYNSFTYKTAEDFIYFILFTFEQLQLSPEQHNIVLSGEIVKNSALFEILYKYIRYVDFIPPNETIERSYILNEISSHTIINLSNTIICGL